MPLFLFWGGIVLDQLKECIWFYTGADYLIINAFLWKNKEALEPCIGIVWQNNRDVIREAEQEGANKRFASSGLDGAALLECYRRRTPDELTHDAKRSILEQAVADIRLLCSSMQPTKEPIILIRNMEKPFCLKAPHVGENVELLGLTSTSTTGQQIDYGDNDFRKPAQVLRLNIPAGTPALFLENDEHEVLLPPLSYAIKGAGVENGVPTVTLDAVSPLDHEQLIKSSEDVFSEYSL